MRASLPGGIPDREPGPPDGGEPVLSPGEALTGRVSRCSPLREARVGVSARRAGTVHDRRTAARRERRLFFAHSRDRAPCRRIISHREPSICSTRSVHAPLQGSAGRRTGIPKREYTPAGSGDGPWGGERRPMYRDADDPGKVVQEARIAA
jgi:hypothetical protein